MTGLAVVSGLGCRPHMLGMGGSGYELSSCLSMSAVGVTVRGGRWVLSRNFLRPLALGVRVSEAEEFDWFVRELLSMTQRYEFPQLVFRLAEDVDSFLALDDPRLAALQAYVLRMRVRRSFSVLSAEELLPLFGGSRNEAPWWDSETWFRTLNLLKVPVAVGRRPALDALSVERFHRVPSTRNRRTTNGDTSLFHLERHVAHSDRLIRMLLDPQGCGVLVRAGQLLAQVRCGDESSVVYGFASAEHLSLSFVWSMDEVGAGEVFSTDGWVVALGFGFGTLPGFHRRETPGRAVPLDVHAAVV